MINNFIVGEWVHAHERDSDRTKVFVDAKEPLPLSRGRQRLELRLDGSFAEAQPGADDRSIQENGKYQFDGKMLILHRSGREQPVIYEAMSGSDEKSLELKRL